MASFFLLRLTPPSSPGRRVALLPPAPYRPDAAPSGVSAGASYPRRPLAEGASPPGTLPGSGCPRAWRLGCDPPQLGEKPHEGSGPLHAEGGRLLGLRPREES